MPDEAIEPVPGAGVETTPAAAPAPPSASDELVERWFADWIHGSVVGTNTEHYNRVYAAKEDLKKRLKK